MSKNKLQIDVLPSRQAIEYAPVQRAELDRLVQEKVAEIMAQRDALVFEPFFRTRQLANELMRLQTRVEQRKFSRYIQRFGCMICGTHAKPHAGNGMCHECRSRVFRRLSAIISEEVSGLPAEGGSVDPSTEGARWTWNYRQLTPQQKRLYMRVAGTLKLTAAAIYQVDKGHRTSARISAALKEERERMDAEETTVIDKKELCRRVAKKLALSPRYVGEVDLGHHFSARVSDALTAERERMVKERS